MTSSCKPLRRWPYERPLFNRAAAVGPVLAPGGQPSGALPLPTHTARPVPTGLPSTRPWASDRDGLASAIRPRLSHCRKAFTPGKCPKNRTEHSGIPGGIPQRAKPRPFLRPSSGLRSTSFCTTFRQNRNPFGRSLCQKPDAIRSESSWI